MFVFDRYYSSIPHSIDLARLTVFRKQIVCSPDDEFRNKSTELFQLHITLQFIFLRCIGISSPQNLGLEILLEIKLGTQVFGVGEIEKGKVFRQIVLNGCTGQDDSSLNIEGGKSLESERICRSA